MAEEENKGTNEGQEADQTGTPRPQRSRTQTSLYQADSEEQKEKEKRAVKTMEERPKKE